MKQCGSVYAFNAAQIEPGCSALPRLATRHALAVAVALVAAARGADAQSGVAGWGASDFGQTVAPSSLSPIEQVACGWAHSVGLTSDGTVLGWGRNNHGESVPPASIGAARQVAAGWDHSVVLKADGGVVCFGAGGLGMSGFPHYGQSVVPSNLGVATQVAAGGYHTLAMRADGTVRVWGLNSYGQLNVPASIGAVAQISGGNRHSAARRADGSVVCWGDAQYGQCSVPAGLGPVAEVDGGGDFTAARMSDGTVRCWGDNTSGQCNPPAGLGEVRAIAAGLSHVVAARSDGSVVCWGANGLGQATVPASLGFVTAVGAGSSFTLAAATEVHDVPGEFATIQAAIDAVPAGVRRIVRVASGTYNEAFALNGKNVVVRGAAGNATVIDGTGLSTSIARFTGGEPATAGLENLVFRNGTAGTRPTPKSSFTLGGALYAANSDAFVRNCRFESNRATFGGAAYLFLSRLAVEDCVFTLNAAANDGGALQAFRCAGGVTGCAFTDNDAGLVSSGSGSAMKFVGARSAGGVLTVEDCVVTGNMANVTGAAIEHFEDTDGVPGVLRLLGCTVSANVSGQASPTGAGGLRVIGRQQSCVLGGGTTVCGNLARNVSGGYLASGAWTVCDCEADVFENGIVDGADLGIVLSMWGAPNPNGTGDLNHDGSVDGADLTMLLNSWGACQ